MTIGPKPTIRRSVALAQDLALADRDRRRLDRRQVEARVARVVQRERVVLAEGGAQQPAQLLLVLGRGDDEVGQLALGRQGEHALVAGAVLADEAGAVDADDHRRVVLADVVDGLVEGALQERRVDAPRTAACPPSASPVASVMACCSAMPTSYIRVGNAAWNLREAGAGGHARRDGHDARVVLGRARSARRP